MVKSFVGAFKAEYMHVRPFTGVMADDCSHITISLLEALELPCRTRGKNQALCMSCQRTCPNLCDHGEVVYTGTRAYDVSPATLKKVQMIMVKMQVDLRVRSRAQ